MKLIPSMLVLQVAESGRFYLRIPLLMLFTLIHPVTGPFASHLSFHAFLASPRSTLGYGADEVLRRGGEERCRVQRSGGKTRETN